MDFSGNWENIKVPISGVFLIGVGGDPGRVLGELLAYFCKTQRTHQKRRWQTLAENTGDTRTRETGQGRKEDAWPGEDRLPGEGGEGICEEMSGVENPSHRILGDEEEDGPGLGRYHDAWEGARRQDMGSPGSWEGPTLAARHLWGTKGWGQH